MNKRLAPVLLLTIPLLLGCARTGSPPGGAADKQGPEVVATLPEVASTNVPVDISPEITFSERVEFSTVAKGFSLSPPPPGAVRAYQHGRRFVFKFDPPLVENRTYVLTMGTDVRDERRNPMVETFHLPFSTGDRLDRAWLEGRLLSDGPPSGWTLVGYRLTYDENSVAIDPNPAYDLPDAATQANLDGLWQMVYLRPGFWRVFAFKDADGDRLWTPWSELLAVPAYDVLVSEDSSFVPRFQTLLPRDVVRIPEPVRVTSLVKDVLDVRFDGQPPTLDLGFQLETLPDTLAEQMELSSDSSDLALAIEQVKFKAVDSSTVELRLSGIPKSEALMVRIFGDFGLDTVAIDTTLPVSLLHAAERDTFLPALLKTTPEVESRLFESMDFITLTFSKPMAEFPKDAVRLVYMSSEDSSFATVGELDAYRKSLKVNSAVGGELRVELFGGRIHDIFGNSVEDSLKILRFTLLPRDSLGSISGVVSGGDPGVIHLTLRSISGVDLPLGTVMEKPGQFSFKVVPAGQWQLEGWIDRVGSGPGWDRGSASPFVPSDPIYLAPDTITVRARWESGGAALNFP